MQQVNLFNDEFKNIRMELVDDEPWYVFDDICREFDSEYPEGKYGRIYYNLPNNQKGFFLIDNLNDKAKILTVNSRALLPILLLLGLDNDKSREFNKWIYYQVVPSIMKTGSYTDSKNKIDDLELYLKN